MNQLSYHSGPPQTTPEQRLLLMNDVEWEIFIEQCARQLMSESIYSQVHRLGGAGDKGRDVCGYTQNTPAENTWDLYQAKHYEGTLSPSEFYPELAKFISNVFLGSYTRPRNYFLCALRVGPKLFDFVMNPLDFKKSILNDWRSKTGNFKTFTPALTTPLENFVNNFPFEIIQIKTAIDLLEIHARSSKHWEMFGVLALRGLNPEVPELLEENEQKYVAALLKVYDEVTETTVVDPVSIPPFYKKHFKAQRRLFYSAEGLNRFSRDKLPGAFDDLTQQVEVGISSDLSFPHPNGITRLTSVTNKAAILQVPSNPLHARLQAGDLHGICHHLANQERIIWVDENE